MRLVARANVRCMSVNWNVRAPARQLLWYTSAQGRGVVHQPPCWHLTPHHARRPAARAALGLQDKERAAEKAFFNQEDEKLLRVRAPC